MSDGTALIGVPWASRSALYAAATVLPVFGVYLVVLRARRRFVLEVPFDWDDWLLAPAFLFTLGCALTLIVGIVNMGIGYPAPATNDTIWCVPPVLQLTVKIELAFLLQMTLAFGLLKMSVTFFYRRIFATRTGSVFDWVSWFVILISGLWMLVFFILFVVQASRQSTALGQLSADGTCSQQYYFLPDYFVLSDLMTNVLVWLLPFPMVARLAIRPAQKFQILAALSLSAISVIGGAIKTMISLRVETFSSNTNPDWELTITTALYWCLIEGGLAVIASCLPDLYYYAMKLADPEPDEPNPGLNKPLPQTPTGPTVQIRKFSVGTAPNEPVAYPRPILRNPQSGAFRNAQSNTRGVARAQLKFEMDHRRSQDIWGADRTFEGETSPQRNYDPHQSPRATHSHAPTKHIAEVGPDPLRQPNLRNAFADNDQDSIDAACPIHGSHALHPAPAPANTPNSVPISRYASQRQREADDVISPAPRPYAQYADGSRKITQYDGSRQNVQYPNGPPPRLAR